MNHCGTKRLETKKLVLRRLTESDAKAMFRNWASDRNNTGICDISWYSILRMEHGS